MGAGAVPAAGGKGSQLGGAWRAAPDGMGGRATADERRGEAAAAEKRKKERQNKKKNRRR